MRSLSSILKYFMKPKADDYELPDTEEMTNQLEEMVRFQESIPTVNGGEPENDEFSEFLTEAERKEPDLDEHQNQDEVSSGAITFAQAQAEVILKDAKEQAEQILSKAKMAAEAEVGRIKQQAVEEGFQKGYSDGFEKAKTEAAEAVRENAQRTADDISRFMHLATQAREHAIDHARDELLDVAVTIAEKVIHVSLKSSREVIRRMILSATEKLKRREWVQIYIADCDVKGVTQTDPMLAAALSTISEHVKIVPMHDAETGTCIVEMPDEIIDASASTQLENIRTIIRDS